MKKAAATFAAALAISIIATGTAFAAGAIPKNPRPPENYQGQWYTSPDGCSYSRAKAPGYAVSWHLILNPFHIGQPNAKLSCPPML